MAYDLEEQEQLATLKAWWGKYGNLVSWLAAAVLAAYAAWSGWNYYQRSQSTKAAVLYEEIVKAAEQKDLAKITRASADMKDRFGGTAYAQMATLVAAKAAFDANDMKAANETYGGFIGLVKWGSVVVAIVTAGVIALIA